MEVSGNSFGAIGDAGVHHDEPVGALGQWPPKPWPCTQGAPPEGSLLVIRLQPSTCRCIRRPPWTPGCRSSPNVALSAFMDDFTLFGPWSLILLRQPTACWIY
eukprot:9488728-Pyramimonas_sp.AAC.2